MSQPGKKSNRNIVLLIIFIVPSLLFMVTAFNFFGDFYIKSFLPIIRFGIERIHPEYDILTLKLDKLKESKRIFFRVEIHRPYIDKKGMQRTYRTVNGNIHASTLHIHPIIIYSLLLAWPGLSIKEKSKAALLSLPLLVFIELIDIPVQLIHNMETFYPADSFFSQARIFYINILNIGGRQFLALLVFILSIAPFHLNIPLVPAAGVERNAPCPCGSGKKFKNCCRN